MIASPDDLRRLIEIAGLDTELEQLAHRRKTLPELAEAAQARRQARAAQDALVEAGTKRSDVEVALAKSEADLEPVRGRLARNQARVDDGSVTDPKSLRAMIEENQHIARRIETLEDEELEWMQAAEDARGAEAEAETALQAAQAGLAEAVRRRDERVAGLDAQIAATRAHRDRIAGQVAEPTMALYERIRARTGVGAALLERNRCTGCGLELPASDLKRYAEAADGEVLRCAECERILVRAELARG